MEYINNYKLKTEWVKGNSKIINTNSLKSGVYVLKIQFENGEINTRKITIVR